MSQGARVVRVLILVADQDQCSITPSQRRQIGDNDPIRIYFALPGEEKVARTMARLVGVQEDRIAYCGDSDIRQTDQFKKFANKHGNHAHDRSIMVVTTEGWWPARLLAEGVEDGEIEVLEPGALMMVSYLISSEAGMSDRQATVLV